MVCSGCAWDGGSLLATLTSDYQLVCWEPPRSRQDLCWVQFESITNLLYRHLKNTSFHKDTLQVGKLDNRWRKVDGGDVVSGNRIKWYAFDGWRVIMLSRRQKPVP